MTYAYPPIDSASPMKRRRERSEVYMLDLSQSQDNAEKKLKVIDSLPASCVKEPDNVPAKLRTSNAPRLLRRTTIHLDALPNQP